MQNIRIIVERFMVALLFVILTSQCVFADDPSSVIKCRVDRTDSLADRGVMLGLFEDYPFAWPDFTGRYFEWTFFWIPKVGAKAIKVDCGSNGGDNLPLGSKVDTESYIATTLTERNEAIKVVNIRGEIEAHVELIVYKDYDYRLVDLRPEQLTGAVTVDATGSFADDNLIITLRAKENSYSFKLTSGRWVPLPKPLAIAKPKEEPPLGDQMRVEFCGQKVIGEKRDSYLVTLFVEEPQKNKKGQKTAFYYFISQTKGDPLRYLDCHVAMDERSVGSGWDKNDPAANPEIINSGQIDLAEAFDLKIGSEVCHYRGKNNSDILINNRALAREDPSIKRSSIEDPPQYEWEKVDASSRPSAK